WLIGSFAQYMKAGYNCNNDCRMKQTFQFQAGQNAWFGHLESEDCTICFGGTDHDPNGACAPDQPALGTNCIPDESVPQRVATVSGWIICGMPEQGAGGAYTQADTNDTQFRYSNFAHVRWCTTPPP